LLQLAALLQSLLKLIGNVEMIFDDRLVAACDEYKMLDPGLARFLDNMLEDRTIDNSQHFLGNRFGRREKSCSQSGDRKNGLANSSGHQSSSGLSRRLTVVPGPRT